MLNETFASYGSWALRIFTAVFDFEVANTNQSLVAKFSFGRVPRYSGWLRSVGFAATVEGVTLYAIQLIRAFITHAVPCSAPLRASLPTETRHPIKGPHSTRALTPTRVHDFTWRRSDGGRTKGARPVYLVRLLSPCTYAIRSYGTTKTAPKRHDGVR